MPLPINWKLQSAPKRVCLRPSEKEEKEDEKQTKKRWDHYDTGNVGFERCSVMTLEVVNLWHDKLKNLRGAACKYSSQVLLPRNDVLAQHIARYGLSGPSNSTAPILVWFRILARQRACTGFVAHFAERTSLTCSSLVWFLPLSFSSLQPLSFHLVPFLSVSFHLSFPACGVLSGDGCYITTTNSNLRSTE